MAPTFILNVGALTPEVTALIDRIMNPAVVDSTPPVTSMFPLARPGERYAGIVLKDDGTPSHHVFALPASDKKMDHADAVAWMDSVGSRPTRSEGALIYANLRQHFRTDSYYWLGDEFAAGSAWCQHFGHGTQGSYGKGYEFLALAVRRLEI